MKQKTVIILSCVGLISLSSWLLWTVFHIQRNNICLKSSYVFSEVLKKEKMLRIEQVIWQYDQRNSPNDITGEEKKEWFDQEYIFRRDSTRTLLDSLFRAALLEADIEAETAIRCIRNTVVTNTSADSVFYEEAIPLKQFVYRVDEDPDKNIMLQAYIKLPFVTVWQYGYLMWLVSGVTFLLLGGIFCGYKFGMNIIPEVKFTLSQQELQEMEKQSPSLLIQNRTIEWVRLSEDLSFNKEHGSLRYKGDTDIYLPRNLQKLFSLFITVEQLILTHENICTSVLARSTKDGLSKSDRNAVASTIRHLRERLKPIPIIEIKQLSGVGYQMLIKDPEDV